MNKSFVNGFSLVEILVSLFIVSMAAASVYGLQKTVIDQNRDNVAYKASIDLATEEMANVLKLENIDDALDDEGNVDHNNVIDAVCDLNDETKVVTKEATQGATQFNLKWVVSRLDDASGTNCRSNVDFEDQAGKALFKVDLTINWKGVNDEAREYVYSEQINPFLSLLGAEDTDLGGVADIIASLLKTDEIIYFEPKMGYKKGAFVIYNSELFEATSVHSVGNGHPRKVDDPVTISAGWKSYGLINDKNLENMDELSTLLLDPPADP